MRKSAITLLLLSISTSIFSEESLPNSNEIGLVFSNLNSFGIRYKYGNNNTVFRLTSLILNGTNTSSDYGNYSGNGIDVENIPNSITQSLGAGLNFGFEKRKRVSNKSFYYYGLDWVNSYSWSKNNVTTPGTFTQLKNNSYGYATDTVLSAFYNNSNNTTTWTVSSGLGIVLGLSFKVNEAFFVSAEIEPTISYKYSKTTATVKAYTAAYAENDSVFAYLYNNTSQATINKGFTGSFSNSAASIGITYRFK